MGIQERYRNLRRRKALPFPWTFLDFSVVYILCAMEFTSYWIWGLLTPRIKKRREVFNAVQDE